MILHLADVHINDFRVYNIDEPYYRLHQFLYLGDWLSSFKPTSVVISGDLFHVSKPSAKTTNVAIDFIEKFDCPVYMTHGQHDLDEVRSDTTVFEENTYLTIVNRVSNAKYLHREYINIEGLKYYFLGWEPTINFDEVEEHDIFVGHFTPQGVSTGSGYKMKSGFSIDLSKFKLAFVGDIHKHQIVKDKIVVPGTPLQNSFSDSPDVGVIMLDSSTLKWERIETPKELVKGTKRLRFLTTNKIYKDPYIKTKKPLESVIKEAIDLEPTKIFNPLTILDKVLEDKHHLMDIHGNIITKVSMDDKALDLRFRLLSLSIENFLTIPNLDVDFNELGGVALMSGENGTGKSSLLKAIRVSLEGATAPKDYVSWWAEDFKLTLKVAYSGHVYTIIRGTEKGSGLTKVEIDGKPEDKGLHSTTCDFLEKELPFIKRLDLMIFNQDRKEFLSSYKFTERVKLISNILGLTTIDNIYDAAKALYDSSKDYVGELETDISNINIRIEEINKMISTETSMDLEGLNKRLSEVEGDLSKVKSEKDTFSKMYEQVSNQIATMRELMSSQQKNKSRVERELIVCDTQLTDIHNNKCYACGQIIDKDKMEAMAQRILHNKEQFQKELQEVMEQAVDTGKYDNLIEMSAMLQEKVKTLQNHFNELFTEKLRIENINKAYNTIGTLEQQCLSLKDDYEAAKAIMSLNKEYMDLVSPDGEVILTILAGVAKVLTNEKFKVETYKQQKNKKIKPDFGVYYLKNKRWINYDNCSGGEKCLIDLYILSKLFEIAGGCGLLVFDEFLAALDKKNTEEAMHITEKLPVDNCFVVSHVANFPYYNSQIVTSMDEEGKSSYRMD